MPHLTVETATGSLSHRLEKDLITLGRGRDNDVCLGDPQVSRRHAEIRRGEDGWVLIDLSSRHGSRLNGRKVAGSAPLAAGDRISLGGSELRFEPRGARAVHGDHSTAGSLGEGAAAVAAVLVGRSPAVRVIADLLPRIAASRETVLVSGENGTGKDIVARLIHALSPRADRPFVVVNCPALPGSLLEAELFGIEKGVATGVEARPGRFEVAAGGTLFLDEIGDMDLAAQAKLLRVLQDRTVERLGGRQPLRLDVRVVAATNHDLEADIARGAFRRDLLHRLDVLAITLPPLRERREDIPLLVEHFLRAPGGPRLAISSEAMALLLRHGFPGNVRELENVIRRARSLAAGETIRTEDLPAPLLRAARITGMESDAPAGSVLATASAAATTAAAVRPGSTASGLYHRVVHDGESFWEVVRDPFLRHDLSREEVRELVARAHAEAGGSYTEAARLLGVGDDSPRFLDFVRNHRLRLRDR